MKTLTSIPRVEAKPGGVEFEFGYDDGTKDVLFCPTDFQTNFLAQFSSATVRQLTNASNDGARSKYSVSFEAGTGRVNLMLQVSPTDGLQLIISDGLARGLGEALIEAADSSVKPQTRQ